MKRSLSVCLSWIPIWVKWKVFCPSVLNANIRGEMKCSLSVLRRFQYKGWKKFVRLVWIPISEVKWRLSVCHYCIVHLSCVDWNMRVKRNAICLLGFQYDEWNGMLLSVSLTPNMRSEMKRILSVCHKCQHNWWNEMKHSLSVRPSCVDSNIRGVKSLSVCLTSFPIWG